MRHRQGSTESVARLSSPKSEDRRELNRREFLRTVGRGAALTGLGLTALALLCRGDASEICADGAPYQGCLTRCGLRDRCGFIRPAGRYRRLSGRPQTAGPPPRGTGERRLVEVQRVR